MADDAAKSPAPARTPPAPAPSQNPKDDNKNELKKPKGKTIKVETTGEFGLVDPIDGTEIPHDKAVEVRADSPFIIRQLKIKQLKEV